MPDSGLAFRRKAATVVAHGMVNPRALWIGSAEGMVSSITGLLVLSGAGVCWYLLRWRYLKARHIPQ